MNGNLSQISQGFWGTNEPLLCIKSLLFSVWKHFKLLVDKITEEQFPPNRSEEYSKKSLKEKYAIISNTLINAANTLNKKEKITSKKSDTEEQTKAKK